MGAFSDPALIANILRGNIPVAAVWTTAPTNLANCTDGDPNSVTGTGSKVMGAAGDYGTLVFDLGAIKTVLVGGRIGIWSTAGSTYVRAAASDDNADWSKDPGASSNALMGRTTVSESVLDTFGILLTGRYIRLAFYVNAAATANAKIYEVMAYELRM